MRLKLFAFSKTEKSPKIIEDRINGFLENNSFKISSQSESNKSGKLYLSIYYEEGPSGVRVKVFKDTNTSNMEDKINSFMSDGVRMKWASQSSSTSSVYSFVFYDELRKADGSGKEKEENKDQG